MSYNDDEYAAFVEELFPDNRFNGFPLSSHKLMLEDNRRVDLFAKAIRRAVSNVADPKNCRKRVVQERDRCCAGHALEVRVTYPIQLQFLV